MIRTSELPNKFVLTHKGQEPLIMDFNPLIESFDLIGNYVLVHYQSKPKYLRTWGVFYEGEYFSIDTITSNRPSLTLKIDETLLSLPPHAVMYYPESKFSLISEIQGVIYNG